MSGQLKEFKKPNPDEGQSFPAFVKPPEDGSGIEGKRKIVEFVIRLCTLYIKVKTSIQKLLF